MEFNLTQFWVPPSGVSPWLYQWIPLFNNPTVVDTGIATNASGANRTVDEIVTIHYPATNQDIIAIDDDAGNDDAAVAQSQELTCNCRRLTQSRNHQRLTWSSNCCP